MRLFQASSAFAVSMLTVSAFGSTPVNIQEFHNPKFHTPIHDVAEEQLEPIKESHPRYRPAKFDVLHYDIDVDVNPESGVIEGSVGVVVKSLVNGLIMVDLDAINMQILNVESVQQNLSFSYDGFIVSANLDTAVNKNETRFLRFRYRALTPQGLQLAGPDAVDPHRMQSAYTYTQPEGSSHWYPCLDRPSDKATMTIKVTVPSGFNALSNGDISGIAIGRTKSEFSYRMEYPVATYLVSLAIGNYDILDIGTFQNKKLTLWAPPSLHDAAVFETARTQEMMEVFSEFTGVAYPFNSYATSVAQGYRSSMEHQAATTMGDWRITGDGSGEGVVAHELAHQWFGDWITCRTWGELWLNEGYASYLPYVFFTAKQDEVRALGQLEYWRDGYFAQAATNVHPLSSANPDMSNIFDSHAYEKGALTIHLMRWITNNISSVPVGAGEEAYTKVLQHYLNSKAGSNVTNFDHERSLATITGQSWETFFDQWVRSEGHPILDIRTSVQGNKIKLTIEQKQFTRADRKWRTFSFPMEVELIFADGTSETRVIDVYEDIQDSELTATQNILAVNIDPELVVPAQVTTDLSAANWLEVLKHSPEVTSRLIAMRRLIALKGHIADTAFTTAILDESSEYIRAAAISELTRKTENLSSVASIYSSLLSRQSGNIATRGAVARAEEWLIKTIGRIPTRDEERSWQDRYLHSDVVAERGSILNLLSHSSLERSQGFAIERLSESKWVMQDRWALVELLTKRPTATSLTFIKDAVKNTSNQHLRQILDNLSAASLDNQEIVSDVMIIAKSHRSPYTRETAIRLLAKQITSATIVCPELQVISTQPATVPDLLQGVRAAASNAITTLGCSAQ